jgi:hypothetical protein
MTTTPASVDAQVSPAEAEVWVREWNTYTDEGGQTVRNEKEYPLEAQYALRRVQFYNQEKPEGIIITRLDKKGGVPIDIPADGLDRDFILNKIEGAKLNDEIRAQRAELEASKAELEKLKAEARKVTGK